MTGTHCRSTPPLHPHSPPSTTLSLLLLLLLTLLLPSLPLALAQLPVQFTIAASPLGHAVATSVTDQGSLVLQRLRTRKALHAQQRLQGVFHQRSSRHSPDAPTDVYECTSLDGPSCAWLNGDDDLADNAAAVQKIIHQLLRTAKSTTAASDASSDAAEDTSGEQGEGQPVVGLVELVQQLLGHTTGQGEAAGEDAGDGRGTEDGVAGGEAAMDGTAGEVIDAAGEEEGESLVVEWEVVDDGSEEVEYELVAIGQDGEARPMTDEELEEFTQHVLAGNVHIDYGDEHDEGEELEEGGEGDRGEASEQGHQAEQGR